MSIKDILLHLDPATDMEADIEAAVRIAEANDAHLAALYTAASMPAWPAYTYAGLPGDVLDTIESHEAKAAEDVRATYEKVVSRSSVSVDFRQARVYSAEVAETVARHARHADMLIMGQSKPDSPRAGGAEVVEEAILGAGRPVLVLPYVGNRETMGQNVIVGWDGSREAARALNDALPFMRKAKSVHVMIVNPQSKADNFSELPGADISLHLARQGLKVDLMEEKASDIDPANLILSRAADIGADLLVMGAFGHSRIRESLLGGVSRSILRQMTMPVLMSH